MLEAPGRSLISRPFAPPPQPPPRAHNHYVKRTPMMASNQREGERDLQSELERERRRIGGALSPEPHLDILRPVSPFQSRRHNPIYQQQQRQGSPSPYSQNTPYQSQSQLHFNAQGNAYAGSSRVQGTFAQSSYPANSYGNAGPRQYRTDESVDARGWGARKEADSHPGAQASRNDDRANAPAARRHEVWNPSAVDPAARDAQARPTSPEASKKRIRRKPVPKLEATPPSTPSTSEASHLPPPNPVRVMPPSLPQQPQQQQPPTSNASLVKSHTVPVIVATTAPPRPTRVATDQVPNLFRDLTHQSAIETGKAKVIPTSLPNSLTLAQQQPGSQGPPASSWNSALAIVSNFKAPSSERIERSERQERADRQEHFERPERADRQERLDRHERLEQERVQRQERLEQQQRAERQARIERQEQARLEQEKQREQQERAERQERELAERQERIERQEKLRKERQERQERIELERQERLAEEQRAQEQARLDLQQERLEQQQKAEREERIAQERQERVDRQERAERLERLDQQERYDRQERPDRQVRAARQERAGGQEVLKSDAHERAEKPPVPVRPQRQDSLQPQLQAQPVPRSRQPSPIPQSTPPSQAQPSQQPAPPPQVQSRTHVSPAPKPALQPRVDPQEYLPHRREPQPPANIQPPPAAYTANHVTHTGALENLPTFPLPAEVRHEVARMELQRPPIVQPQPKKVSSFSQLAAMIRPSRSPSPLVSAPQPVTATNATGLKAQEVGQPSLSSSRSVASSWKNSRSPSPLVHMAESVPSSPPKSSFISQAHQVTLPPSKGSSAFSSRAPSPQDVTVQLGQGLQMQFFSNSNRASPSPSPLALPKALPVEAPLRSYSSKLVPQAVAPTPANISRSTEELIPLHSQSVQVSGILPPEPVSQHAEVPDEPDVPERPRSPSRPVIPQYAPPPPPFPPAPPSTPVLAPKSRAAVLARSQLVPAIEAKCVPAGEVVAQAAPVQVAVADLAFRSPPAATTYKSTRALVALAPQNLVEQTSDPKEERTSTPPLQTGLVTPPETPPTSFQEGPPEKKSKRKSVTSAQDNVIRGSLSSSSKVRSPSPVAESVSVAAPERTLPSRIPVPISRPAREEELPALDVIRNDTTPEVLFAPRPIASVPYARPVEVPTKPVVQPPLPPDWRDFISKVTAPSDLSRPTVPTDYDEDSSMLPPMKAVEKPSASRFDFRKWSEKEQPIVVNPVAELQDREVHVNSEAPVIPVSVLPKEEDLVWHVNEPSRPLPVSPAIPQPEVEKTQPAWIHSSRIDKSTIPSEPSGALPRTYSPVPRKELPRPQEAQKAPASAPEWQVDREDETLRPTPERVGDPAASSVQTRPYDASRERPSGARKRGRSVHHHKREVKEPEQSKVDDDNSADVHQLATASSAVPALELVAKPLTDVPTSVHPLSPEPAPYRSTSPEPISDRPISPPPRNQSLENRRVLNNGTTLQTFTNAFDRQERIETRPSSPPVSTRPASPLPSPPQVLMQTKPPRPPKPQVQDHSKRQAPHEEFRPPTPPHNHYKKKRSYDVLPTDPGNFLKPATHLLYPDTSSDCHSLMPAANASRLRLPSESRLRYESSRDTVGLQSRSARNLHSRKYTERERGRGRVYPPTSDTREELRSETDEESEPENDLPSPPGSDSSHGEHRVRHLDNDPYTDVTIERATRGYRSKPVGRARAHTLTLPPNPATARDRHARRRRSRSPASSSGRSRSGHRPRATKPGRSQSEKVTRDRGVSPLGRSRSSPLPSTRTRRQGGFWRSFGSWAMLFFSKFRRWGSASAPNSPATIPRRRRDYDSDYY